MPPKDPRRLAYLLPVAAAAVAALASGGRTLGLLLSTLQVAAGALALALPVGAALAVLIYKVATPGRRAGGVVLLAMLFMPLHLHAAAWRAGFGSLGWFTQWRAADQPTDPLLDGLAGAAWVHGAAAIAWVALIVGAALRSIDARLEEHALLSMPARQVLWRVSLVGAAPALVIAAGWVLVTVAHEMSVTDYFQVRTFAEEVYTQHALGLFDPSQLDDPAQRLQAWQLAAGLAAVWGVGVGVLWAARGFIARAADGVARAAWRARPGSIVAPTALLLALSLLAAGVPLGSLVVKAGASAARVGDAWRHEWSLGKAATRVAHAPVEHRRQLWQSAKLGVGVATGAALLGAAIAWRLARRPRERLWWLAALALALTTPGPLIGLAAIRVFNQPAESPLWLLSWLYDHTLLVAWGVQMIRVTPLAALALWPVWQGLPRGLIDAARLDGDGPLRLAWSVAARSRPAAVAAAWLVALATSFGELSATLLVMPPGPQTMTIELFNLLHSGVDDRVAAISLFMIAALAVIAWGVTRLWGRAAEPV